MLRLSLSVSCAVLALVCPAFAQCDEDKLLPTVGSTGAALGYAVDMFGDVALVGAPSADFNGSSGAVYEWTRSGGNWTETQKFAAADSVPQDRFGSSIAIDGNFALIGAAYDSDVFSFSGSAYLFERTASGWVERHKFVPPDPSYHKNFGHSVGISGSTIVVGAWQSNTNNPYEAGQVYVFDGVAGVWTLTQQLGNSTGDKFDGFARDLALDGDTLVVGAYRDGGNGGSSNEHGAAHVFGRATGAWTPVTTLYPTLPASVGWFGMSVALDGDRLLVGAPADGDIDGLAGAVYGFRKLGGAWQLTDKFYSPDGGQDDLFGFSVGIDEERAVVSSHFENESGTQSGSAYVLADEENGWRVVLELQPSDVQPGQWFGVSSAISRANILVGSQRDGTQGTQAGAAYSFDLGGSVDNFCSALPNSTGVPADIGWKGYTSLSANAFTLTVVHAPANKAGLFFYGPQQVQVPFGNGLRCVGGGFYRLTPTQTTDASGSAMRAVDFNAPPASGGSSEITAGSTWNFQFWYRDPAGGGAGFNLSDGLSATFCP